MVSVTVCQPYFCVRGFVGKDKPPAPVVVQVAGGFFYGRLFSSSKRWCLGLLGACQFLHRVFRGACRGVRQGCVRRIDSFRLLVGRLLPRGCGMVGLGLVGLGSRGLF